MSAWLAVSGWLLVCSAVAIGLGALTVRSILGGQRLEPARLFWVGLIAALTIALWAHLLVPLDGRVSAVLAALALVGWARNLGPLAAAARTVVRRAPLSAVSWVACLALLPAVTLQPLTCIDAGFYYIASVKWHQAYAQIPGLQATNPLSVMNTGYFQLVALTGVGPFREEGHLVFNGLLALWGLPLAISGLERLAAPRPRLVHLALALSGAPAIDALTSDRMSCPSSDIAVLWCGVAIVGLGVRRAGEPDDPPRWRQAAWLVCALPLIKTSLVTLSLMLGLGLLLATSSGELRRQWRWGLGLGAVSWLPWLAGNVIVSGFPLYPAAFGRFGFDWALPASLVRHVGWIIREYSRHDGIQGDPTRWEAFSRLLLMNRGVSIPFALTVLGTLATIAALGRRQDFQSRSWSRVAPVPLAWLGWVVWFELAPDPRFAGVALWTAGAWCVGLGIEAWHDHFPPRAELLGAALVALLMGGDLPFLPIPASLPVARPVVPVSDGRYTVTLRDGTRLNDCTPDAERDAGLGTGCWTLPAAAIFPPGLELRVPGDLSRGFSVPSDAELPKLNTEKTHSFAPQQPL